MMDRLRRWITRHVIADDPMDDERRYWQHQPPNHCTDPDCPCRSTGNVRAMTPEEPDTPDQPDQPDPPAQPGQEPEPV